MKLTILNKYFYTITSSALFLMLIWNVAMAKDNLNYVIISGQVTNIECGIAVDKHTVHIESNTIVNGRSTNYYNTVTTNHEGYYYDTIYTEETKGSFLVYTYDFSGQAIDTTIHFRFIDKSNDIIIANLAIFLPYQAWKLQAKFKYTEEFDDAGFNNFKFIDQTENNDIIDWHWDFGDGTTSKLQNPSHRYQSYGLFIVRFSVTAIIDNEPKISTITKQIHISKFTYCHMGGHVFSEYFPIDMGKAYLYMVDSSDNYFPIDTIAFDTLGYYYFYKVPVGTYLVKVEPMLESEYYGKLLPTYYGGSMFWEDAELIQLNHTNWEYNINLSYSEGALTGNGSINGNIEYVELPRSFHDFSAEGVNIYLLDESNNLLTCHYSDIAGDFYFNSIELNKYWLYPEVTGIHSEKTEVELSPETPNINNINFTIYPNGISSVQQDEESLRYEEVGLPYPNPVSKTLNLPLNLKSNNNISIEVFDMYGQKILSDEIGNHINNMNHQISVDKFSNGTYILRSKVNEITYDRIFIVAR